jgi:hypothetical protein
MSTATELDNELADEVGKFYADPFGFVRFAYPWGEPGPLSNYQGPDVWQEKYLRQVGEEILKRRFDGLNSVDPLREATASGHGIGKSTVVAWLVNWIMSTRPNAQGTVTANTFPQLRTKTWAAIQKWNRLSITQRWFTTSASRMYQRDHPATWFCSPQTCREENSEAFAGQHAASSTSFYIFDEASAVPDIIFEVAEGGMTDGEPMMFAFGNPTRNTGKFFRATFGPERGRWIHRSIDSRECALPNKSLIQEWIADYGEDSDFVRVRVRGLPPRASEIQFIDLDRIYAAQKKEAQSLPDDPLIAGVDVSGGGSAWNVVRFRRGKDARTLPPVRIAGSRADREALIAMLAALLQDKSPEKQIQVMFIDSAFGSPIVERLHVLGNKNVVEVNFGGRSPDIHQLNLRAYMWNQVKEWLPSGSIDPNDEQLEIDLSGPGFHFNKTNQLVLEPKEQMLKRGLSSPDDGDALALTFAQAVAPAPKKPKPSSSHGYTGPGSWMT